MALIRNKKRNYRKFRKFYESFIFFLKTYFTHFNYFFCNYSLFLIALYFQKRNLFYDLFFYFNYFINRIFNKSFLSFFFFSSGCISCFCFVRAVITPCYFIALGNPPGYRKRELFPPLRGYTSLFRVLTFVVCGKCLFLNVYSTYSTYRI